MIDDMYDDDLESEGWLCPECDDEVELDVYGECPVCGYQADEDEDIDEDE